jgi:hypothetical protein
MRPRSRLPVHAVRLETYGELEAYVRAFAAGHLAWRSCGPPSAAPYSWRRSMSSSRGPSR